MVIFFTLHLHLVVAITENYVQFATKSWTPPEKRDSLELAWSSPTKFYLFGGINQSQRFNDLWIFYIDLGYWERIEIPTYNIPSSRSEFAFFQYNKDTKIYYLFGGIDDYGYKTDLWEYNEEIRRWDIIYEFSEVASLYSHATCHARISDKDYIFLYGGKTLTGLNTNLWKIDVETFVVESFQQNEDPPREVIEGNIFYYDGAIYQLWGKNEMDVHDRNMYKYSLDNQTWTMLESNLGDFIPTSSPKIAVHKNSVFVYGGIDEDRIVIDRILKINLQELPLVVKEFKINNYKVKHRPGLLSVEDYLWIFGGFDKTFSNELLRVNITDYTEEVDLEIVIKDSTFPSERVFSTAHLIDNKAVLFGGNNGDTYFNDLWYFFTNYSIWNAAESKGSIPSRRTSHAAGSHGDALVIWGGEDANGYKNDMFIYNTLSSYWEEVIASNQAPSSRKGACGILRFPKFFILGGKTYAGVSNEVWEYDFSTNLYNSLTGSPIKFYNGKCQYLNKKIYILGAKDSQSMGMSKIMYYYPSQDSWGYSYYKSEGSYLAESVSIVFPDYLIEYSGIYQELGVKPRIRVYLNDTNIYVSDATKWSVFATDSVYSKANLIYYGGGVYQDLITPTREKASNQFNSILIGELALTLNITSYCSEGTYRSNSFCEYCPQGTYSDGFGYSKCTTCPPGTVTLTFGATSMRQCYPCDSGTFNNPSELNECRECSKTSYCPIGSTKNEGTKPVYIEKSIQPKNYQDPNLNQKISSVFLYAASVSVAGTIMLLLLIPYITRKIKEIDMFSTSHEKEINKPLILRNTTLGGIFTMIFIGSAAFIVGYNAIQYFLKNVEESKSLQPLSVFQNEVQDFSSELNVSVIFHYYGDKCIQNGNCSDQIHVESPALIKGDSQYVCQKYGRACKIDFSCKNCEISSQYYLTYRLTEDYSFATAISVTVASTSSVPESDSIMSKTIQAKTGYVFSGSTPSEFFYSFTPSVFYSSLSQFPSRDTGYHVSESSPPVNGTAYSRTELAVVSGLSAIVYLDRKNFGLFTYRYEKQSVFIISSAVLGSVSGIFQIAGFLMSQLEEYYQKLKEFFNKKKKINEILEKRLAIGIFEDVRVEKPIIPKSVSNKKSLTKIMNYEEPSMLMDASI
ncbi:hypothetical protein SteCoe_13017 [Stentor coeruleus]|uniref:Tyrosine-protein kinase ephrin type A/B receptor-like domain-containing protein n=1 Tax=Stentor coeruleus TaxID=5963 RepID=A0A1R2C9B4_9CILI|nr:hypothetical protein SteCoe_13017 [Stentor coeruleus]